MYKPPKNDPKESKDAHSSDSDSHSQLDAIEPASTSPKGKNPFFYDKLDEVIEIFNFRIFKFDEIEMNDLRNCKELILRKNLLHKLDPLPDHLAARLTVLDLFDNKIRKVSDFFESHMVIDTAIPHSDLAEVSPTEGTTGAKGEGDKTVTSENVQCDEAHQSQQDEKKVEETEKSLEDGGSSAVKAAPTIPCKPQMIKKHVAIAFPNLTKLDLSYNQIKKINGLDSLGGSLKELYLVENKIKVVSGLDALVNLELLELGGNNISQIGHSLDNLHSLKELWIGKNKISSLEDSLHQLTNLERLSVQANRLTKIDPENFPEGRHPKLREAFFSENGIKEIENLPLHRIELLDVSMNPISTVNEAVINPENMPELQEFWLTDGAVKDWKEVEKFKPFHKTLRTLYMERNPIEGHIRYRDLVYQHLPFLTQIDSWPIVNKGNLEADRTIQRRAPV